MAAEIELERMVVRLVGDSSQYVQDMKNSGKATKDVAKDVEDSTKKIEGFGGAIQNFAAAASSALAALGIGQFLKESFAAFSEAEDVMISLTAAIGAQGGAVEELSKDYQEFATNLQRSTTMGDEAILTLLKTAATFDLAGGSAKKASKDAIALAAINGSSADSMMRLTAAMASGDTQRAMQFARMVPQLRGVTNETQFLEKYMKLVTAGTEVMGKQADTAGGKLKQLTEEFGNFKELVGKVIADAIKPFATALTQLSIFIQSLPEPVIQLGTAAAGLAVVLAGALSASLALVAVKALLAKAAIGSMLLTMATSPITAWTLAIGVAVKVGVDLAKSIARANESLKVQDDLLKNLSKSSQGLIGNTNAVTQRVTKEAQAHDDNAKKLEVYEREVKKTTKLIEMYKDHVKDAQERVDDLSTRQKVGSGFGLNKDADIAIKALANTKEELEALQTQLGTYNKEITGIKRPDLDPKLIEATEALNKSLKDQIGLFGKEGTELEIHKLRLQGVQEWELRGVEARAKTLKQMGVEKAGKDFTQSLEEQTWNLKRTAEEAALFKLELEDLSEAQLKSAKAALKQFQAGQENLKLMEEGKTLTESLDTPQETYAITVTKLEKLLHKGAITQDVYNRGIQKADKDLYDASKQASTFAKELEKIEGAALGSAEALSRVEAFKETLNPTKFGLRPGGQQQNQPMGPLGPIQGQGMNPLQNQPQGPGGGQGQMPGSKTEREMLDVLKDMREHLRAIKDNKGGPEVKVGV